MLRIDETKLCVAMAYKHLNLTALAKACGVSRQTLGYAKAGKRITTEKAVAIANALDVDIKDLLED